MATITRVFSFDAAHRVMNEKVKCFNLHGHRFNVEVTFEYNTMGSLGYAVDFKELKRIIGAWIDEKMDHSCILNPCDTELIDMCKKNGWRLYVMGMGHSEDINPSAENLASELFYIIRLLFNGMSAVALANVRLYETPNCWVDSNAASYFGTQDFITSVKEWRKEKGEFNYDIRKE